MSAGVHLKARKALAEGRVKKILVDDFFGSGREVEVYVVESRKRGTFYVVIPGVFCSCEDFLYTVFYRGEARACYHMVAVELALKEGVDLKTKKVSFEDFYKWFLSSLIE